MNSNNIEHSSLSPKDWVVIIILFVSFSSSILIFLVDKIPVFWGAAFLALSIAGSLYHFLGGIEHSNEIKFEAIRLSGSAAIFSLILYMALPYINKPVPLPNLQTIFAITEDTYKPIIISIDSPRVQVEDIDLTEKRWHLKPHNNYLRLYPSINTDNTIGYLPKSELDSLSFFNKIGRASNIYLSEPLSSNEIIDRRGFPFYIKPINFNNPSIADFHIISRENKDTINTYYLDNKDVEIFYYKNRVFMIGIAEAIWNEDKKWTRIFYTEIFNEINGYE